MPCLTPHHITAYHTAHRSIPYNTVPSMSSFNSASLELPLTSAFCPKAEGLASQYLEEKKEGQTERNTGGRVGEGNRGEEGRNTRGVYG